MLSQGDVLSETGQDLHIFSIEKDSNICITENPCVYLPLFASCMCTNYGTHCPKHGTLLCLIVQGVFILQFLDLENT